MLKRWIKNIVWLLNHPPTTLTSDDKMRSCYFCNKHSGIVPTWTVNNRTICSECQWRVYTEVLKRQQDK